MKLAYAVVVRRAGKNYSADCPDLPGCIAAGRTVDETLRRMRQAILLHIDGLRARGRSIPRPKTRLASLARRGRADQVFTVLQVAA